MKLTENNKADIIELMGVLSWSKKMAVINYIESLLTSPAESGQSDPMDILKRSFDKNVLPLMGGIRFEPKGYEWIASAMTEFAASETARLRAELDKAKHDIKVYRAALGYGAEGYLNCILSDGTTPQNGIGIALENMLLQVQSKLSAANQRVAELEGNRRSELIRYTEQLKDYTNESHSILGHEEMESYEFVDIFLNEKTK